MKLSCLPLAILLSISFITISSCAGNTRSESLDAALDTLDMVLSERHGTREVRLANAYRMSRLCAAEPTVGNYMRMAQMFDSIDNDSAIIYTNLAINLAADNGDTAQARLIAIDFARRLSRSDLLRPATAILDRITVDSLDLEGKIIYYGTKRKMYLDAADNETLIYLRRQYATAAEGALDTLQRILNEDSGAWHLAAAQLDYLHGKKSLATGELNEVLDNISASDEIYPMACELMAQFNRDRPDKEDEYLYYLTLAATADVRNGNPATQSLITLGTEFFRRGDLDCAYNYLSAAGDYVVRSNSKNLYPQIAPTMSMLVEAMSARESRRTAWMSALIITLAITLIACGSVLYRSARKNSLRRAQNHRLNKSIESRDLYIKQLLDLCSVYIDGLEEFNRLVGRKLKVNQTQDLYKIIESGKIIQDQADRFFDTFDMAIGSIYPDFITELNALLLPDRQIAPSPDGRLTPELRIVAFMRLGVTDSTRLSKFLGLSLNTIYTYRNRMKSRAVNRDTFESDILLIGNKT